MESLANQAAKTSSNTQYECSWCRRDLDNEMEIWLDHFDQNSTEESMEKFLKSLKKTCCRNLLREQIKKLKENAAGGPAMEAEKAV